MAVYKTVSFPHPRRGLPWVVDLTFMGPVGVAGTLECVGFTIRSYPRPDLANDPLSHAPNSEPVFAGLARFDLSTHVNAWRTRLIAQARDLASEMEDWERAGVPPAVLDMQDEVVAELRNFVRIAESAVRKGRPGRPRLSDEFLAAVMTAKSAAEQAGRRDSSKAVAEVFDVPVTTAYGWINKARQRRIRRES